MERKEFVLTKDYFVFSGNEKDFYNGIEAYCQSKNKSICNNEYSIAKDLLHFLFDNSKEIFEKYNIEQNNELIEIKQVDHPTTEERKMFHNALFMGFKEYEYNISISTLTFMLLVLLAPIALKDMPGNQILQMGTDIIALFGINTQAISHIDDKLGERCVLIEICRQRMKKISLDKLYKILGNECINNHLTCKYNKGSRCTITKTDIDEILDILTDRNILKKSNNEYKYKF